MLSDEEKIKKVEAKLDPLSAFEIMMEKIFIATRAEMEKHDFIERAPWMEFSQTKKSSKK